MIELGDVSAALVGPLKGQRRGIRPDQLSAMRLHA